MKPEMDIRSLHDLAEYHFGATPAKAPPVNQSPETADFKNGRTTTHAANGEGQRNRTSMGTQPHGKPQNPRSKPQTQSANKRAYPRAFRKKFLKRHRDKQNTCADKVPYPNSAAAHEVIKGIINRPNNLKRFRSLHAYKCDCGSWHITSR